MYKKLVMNVIYKITNDYHTSQDLCQETFLKAFLNLKKLKKESSFKSWLCKIALNLAKNELRKRKIIEYDNFGRKYVLFELAKEEKEKKKSILINEGLNKLKFKDKFILSMFYFYGFNLKEIKELTGIKEDNLKVILSRARNKLRKKIKGLRR